jgi:hypothetical protein
MIDHRGGTLFVAVNVGRETLETNTRVFTPNLEPSLSVPHKK